MVHTKKFVPNIQINISQFQKKFCLQTSCEHFHLEFYCLVYTLNTVNEEKLKLLFFLKSLLNVVVKVKV